MTTITDADALRRHFGAVSALAARKTMPRLDQFCRDFIALSPFLVLATTDGQGNADGSPRGDAPGFVAVLDDQTLLLPDRPGNRRVDSFNNVLMHPGVGLLFFVPGINETLRVNGTARIATDKSLLDGVAAEGKVPATGLVIEVREAFFHCAKALIRSHLWDQSAQVERSVFPSLGRVVAEQTKLMPATDAETYVETSYREHLY